eukprot:TRINITY_DN9679_c0_g1_i1.p1 TRINITY_DN9679_c0_g1~~TRINITY_DN9679_c0_g1_i1.p1  ORF type:complete len:560 (+),score=112.56 TRINITY_DN9679_c0_g1_i1:124-1803(+)
MDGLVEAQNGIGEVDYLTDEALRTASHSRDLTNVTKLDLQLDTELTMIGDLGRRLPCLRQLRLNGSNIPCVRDLGTSLDCVTVLWMSRCNTTSLAGISALRHLEELYCAFNYVEDISPLGGLPELSTLDLEGNQLQDPEDLQVLAPCEKLSCLTLEGNPAAREAGYRRRVAECLPGIVVLDDEEVGGDSDCGDAISPLPADILALADGEDLQSPSSPAASTGGATTTPAKVDTPLSACSPLSTCTPHSSSFITPTAARSVYATDSVMSADLATPLSACGTAMSTRQLARAASVRRQQAATAKAQQAAPHDSATWDEHWPQCARGGRELQGLIAGMREQILTKTELETHGVTDGNLREREIDLTYESIKRSNTILAEDSRGASACGSRPVSASVRPSTANRVTSLSGARPGTSGVGGYGGYSGISGIAGMFGGGRGGVYGGGPGGAASGIAPQAAGDRRGVPHGSSALTFGTSSVFCGNPTRHLRTKKFEGDDGAALPVHSSSTLAESLDKKGCEAVLESVIASKLAYQTEPEAEDAVTPLTFEDCETLDLQDFTPVDSL